jgi:hypothetical protein
MTPRIEWTWNSNFVFAARVRFFCWQNCWCSNYPNAKQKDLNRWFLSDTAYVFRAPDGSLQVTLQDAKGRLKNARVSRSGIVQDGRTFTSTTTSASSVAGQQFDATDIQLLSSEADPLAQTCGGSCSGPAGIFCSGGNTDGGCRCVVSKFDQVQQYRGLDGAFASAVCQVVPWLGVGAELAALKKQHSRLGGRDDLRDKRNWEGEEVAGLDSDSGSGSDWSWDSDLDSDLASGYSGYGDYICPCNMSYISRACCDSQSGLLWEGGEDGEVIHGSL